MDFIKSSQPIFKAYPKVDAVLFTADGSSFINQGNADNHAKALTDKTITTVTRAQAEAAAAELADDSEAPADDSEAPADDAVIKVKALIKAGKTEEALAAAKLLTPEEAATLNKKEQKFIADNTPAPVVTPATEGEGAAK